MFSDLNDIRDLADLYGLDSVLRMPDAIIDGAEARVAAKANAPIPFSSSGSPPASSSKVRRVHFPGLWLLFQQKGYVDGT